MSQPRFYIPPERWNIDHLVLDEGEARHATQVLRLRDGESVVFFNGQGAEVEGALTLSAKPAAGLRPLVTRHTPPPAGCITLAQAIPKGKNMELVLQKATELGAAEIVPLTTARTIVRIDPAEAPARGRKWQRVAIEACKQCGQNWLPRVHPPVSIESFLSSPPRQDWLLIAAIEPGARRCRDLLAEWRAAHPDKSAPASVLVLIGPEGDFTPAEVELAKNAGCRPMTLGPIILRTETAALFTLSVLAHELS